MNVCPSVLYTFLNSWIDVDDIFCVYLSGSRDDLDSQLEQVGPTRENAQVGILRFTMDIFLYKWLPLLVIGELIISKNLFLLFYWLPLVNRADKVQACIKSNFRT